MPLEHHLLSPRYVPMFGKSSQAPNNKLLRADLIAPEIFRTVYSVNSTGKSPMLFLSTYSNILPIYITIEHLMDHLNIVHYIETIKVNFLIFFEILNFKTLQTQNCTRCRGYIVEETL